MTESKSESQRQIHQHWPLSKNPTIERSPDYWTKTSSLNREIVYRVWPIIKCSASHQNMPTQRTQTRYTNQDECPSGTPAVLEQLHHQLWTLRPYQVTRPLHLTFVCMCAEQCKHYVIKPQGRRTNHYKPYSSWLYTHFLMKDMNNMHCICSPIISFLICIHIII